jgi:tetratricopeptide (TPR) repeat protein
MTGSAGLEPAVMGKAQRRKQERVPAARPPQPARPARAAAVPAAGLGPARAYLAPLLIVALGLVLYANSFTVPFLFDDYFEIANNPLLKTVSPLLEYLQRSRGIPAFTFALNYRWSGLDVWGFHLINVIVHLVNALLVYGLVLRTLTLPGWRERYRHSADGLAALVALVFLAHPLQTMAVSYIVQRTESIAAFFYLLTMLLFSFASTAPAGGRRIALYAGAAISAFLGVVSKEVVATVPLALLAYRLCFLPSTSSRSPGRRLALAAVLLLPLGYALLLARPYLFPAAETLAPDVPRAWLYIPTAGFQLEGVSSWQYLLTQFGIVLWYLRLYVLPTEQCFDYGWPLVDSPWRADVLLPLALLLALLGAALAVYRRYPLATFCIVWMFITLAPTSTIIPLRDAAFEQRMYLPIVGLSWLIVVGGFDALGWLAARVQRRADTLRRVGAAAAGVWIALLGVATIARNRVLQDPVALAADSLEKAPQNWRAHSAYGEAMLDAGHTDEGVRALEEAIRLNPDIGSARVELGQIYLKARRLDEAEAVLRPATNAMEESVAAAAHVQMAQVAYARGDLRAATWELQQALSLKPNWDQAHRQLAHVYARLGLWFSSAGEYQKLLQIKPQLANDVAAQAALVHYNAGRGFQARNQTGGAVTMLRGALRFRPNWAAAHHYLAYLLAANGEWSEAERELGQIPPSDDPLAAADLQRVRDRQPLSPPPPPPKD